jgi:hypothetical protein
VFSDNEDLRERQIELTKDLLKMEQHNETMPIEKGGTARPQRGMKEMTDLLEVMKTDHEALVDTVTLLKT